jgi:plasmid stabilization system protein ParE
MYAARRREEAEMADNATDTQQQDADDTQDPKQGTEDAARGGDDAPQGPNPAEDFESWLESQDEAVRTGYQQTTAGLKSALDKERDRAKEVETELRDALKKLDGVEGAQETAKELEAKLTAAQEQREAAERERDFVSQAVREGVTDPALAWRAVEGNETLTDRYGRADFDALKEQHPALFAKGTPPPPDGTPGSGTGSPPQGKPTMDEIIRGAR